MALVLIGYSACQLTREAFARQGHDAWTCDLVPARGSQVCHLRGDVWDVLGSRPWDFALLHPICTYLTTSAAWAYKDPDFEKYPGVGYHQRVKPGTLTGRARRCARDAELRNFEKLLGLPFPVVIENPATSFVNTAIRPPDQVIHPYDFGDDASKATGLWRTHDAPALEVNPFDRVDPRLVCENGHVFRYGDHRCPTCKSQQYLPRWANQTNSSQNRLSPGDDRWLERSKTYPGIAAALGKQYGQWLNRI